MYKKIIVLFLALIFFKAPVIASDFTGPVNDILSSYNFDHDSVISIAVKDKNGENVYSKNQYKYLNPASALKLFTMAASLNELGGDYKFQTAFYKDKNNNIYLKLSGDPLLKTADIEQLAKNLKQNHKGKINKIYIDDSVIDMLPYPNGWMSDDIWPNSPKISPYMIDFNTVKVDFLLSEDKKDLRIVQKSPYKFSFVNKLQTGSKTDFTFIEDETHNTIDVIGTISSSVTDKPVPVLNPRYFFCQKMNSAINKAGIKFSDKFLFAKMPKDAVLVAKFERPIDEVIKYILQTSNNIGAEMVFKVAGGKFANENGLIKNSAMAAGTTQNGINMFINYYQNLGLDSRQVRITDGSGVSRYNAMNVDWMTDALSKIGFDFEKFLPTGGVGTLDKRLREIKGCVYLKTGTLVGSSSLVGIIKTKDNVYYYASNIMSYNRNKSLVKAAEDEIIFEIYRRGNDEQN